MTPRKGEKVARCILVTHPLGGCSLVPLDRQRADQL